MSSMGQVSSNGRCIYSRVNDELDTQNFEKFEESDNHNQTSSKSGLWRMMLSSKDVNFVGYTYKNFDIVTDHQLSGIAELKRKSTKVMRSSIESLLDDESTNQPVLGSFLNLLPPLEVSQNQSGWVPIKMNTVKFPLLHQTANEFHPTDSNSPCECYNMLPLSGLKLLIMGDCFGWCLGSLKMKVRGQSSTDKVSRFGVIASCPCKVGDIVKFAVE